MIKPPLATRISSLLIFSMIVTPAISFAAGGYRGSVESVAEREKARRFDYERRGKEAIENGEKAMKERDYEKATAYFKNACDIIPNAPNSRSLYADALDGFCEASCKLAEQRITEGRFADAENTLRIVLDDRYDPRCKKAVILLARLEQPDYTARFNLAKKRCEQILGADPYNIAARKFEEKVDRAISDYGVAAYNETRADAIRQTDLAWQRPVRRFNVPTGENIPNGPTDGGQKEKIQRKLERIIIPKLEFREATIREAVDFLKKKSVDLDVDSPAGEKGVNIVLKLDAGSGGGGGGGLPEAAPAGVPGIPGLDAAPAAVPAAGVPAAPVGNPSDARITVSLTNIPLIEALRYVTGLANLKFKVEPYAVSVVPASVNTDVLVTREWKIRPDLIPRTPGAGGAAGAALAAPAFAAGGGGAGAADATKGGSGIADRESAKNWLIANGVQFNGQASAIYIVSNSRLIVRNTQDQLDLIDTIIVSGAQNQGPTQIDIEAKFVEITQNNLKELSFDWLVGPSNLPGNHFSTFVGGGTSGTSPALANADFPFQQAAGPVGTSPITAGNRSGNVAISANAIDALLFTIPGASRLAPALGAISGVFTDPQFQLVIRALNQKKGVDLLSAPRVTTKSGQRAVIEIIREFRYPTEFDPPQIPQTFQSPAVIGAIVTPTANFPVTPTTPTAFETRNTGVTLEVEPVVGPDGYTIDLNLVPQVVEFEGFINYGSPIQTQTTNPVTGATTTNVLTPNVINQPIFSTRKVTTSVSVFDGSTIVLGGLIREDVQKVEDKVPFFGDIPVLGRLFRSSVDQHLKRNLVIFVTARLINPAGEAVRMDDEREEVVETIAPPDLGSSPLELPLMSK